MFLPHDAVGDALLRRVEEAEHGDDAGNLRLCERGFRGVRVVVGGVVVGGVFRGSGRGIADGWRRRPLARFARGGGGRLDGRGGGEDLASGVPVKRIVAVPSRRGCPEDERFIERGEGCASSSAFFLRYRAAARVVGDRRRWGPRRGAWVRRGRPSCGPGAEDLGFHNKKGPKTSDGKTNRRAHELLSPD